MRVAFFLGRHRIMDAGDSPSPEPASHDLHDPIVQIRLDITL
jgi:hypothetical protein